MTVATSRSTFGRHLFGIAAIAFGLIALIHHDYHDWPQLRPLLNLTTGRIFLAAVVGAQIFGGVALQFHRTARFGALLLAATYLVFAISHVPRIVAAPHVYDRWGNFFEQFALVTGAAVAYARSSVRRASQQLARVGCISLGICAASFAAEQAVYLNNTIPLVPKWLPPSQSFWAIVTTAAFALAAAALIANRGALLAAQLLTTMLGLFGLVVWLPLLLTHLHDYANWSETVETFAIAGSAWIVADLLREYRPSHVHRARTRRQPRRR